MKRQMKPVHRGAILREDILKQMNLTITQAAKGVEVNRKQLSQVVNETVSVSAEMAVRLEQAFGVNAEFWLDMQNKYDVWKVQNSNGINVSRFDQINIPAS